MQLKIAFTSKVSIEGCHTSYVWLGNTSKRKDKLGEGTNPNNNVIYNRAQLLNLIRRKNSRLLFNIFTNSTVFIYIRTTNQFV